MRLVTLHNGKLLTSMAHLVASNVPILFSSHATLLTPFATVFAGAWVKMRNVGAFVTQGQLQCAFHAGSKWTPWYDTADTLAEDAQRRAANNTAGASR